MNKVKGIKRALAQTSKILNKTLNIHIQNHLVNLDGFEYVYLKFKS